MDRHAMALLIPILALTIPVVAIVMGGMVKMARLRAQSQVTFPPEVEQRMAVLEEEVATLRHELGETQERLDFTERLLARKGDEQQPRLKQ